MRRSLRGGILGVCCLAGLGIAASHYVVQTPVAGAAEPAAGGHLDRYEFLQIQMGVPFRITLYGPDEASANAAAHDAYRRIKQLNAVFSDYDPDSETSRLCQQSVPGKPVKVSDDFRTLLSRSLALSRASDGAFDVTVGPVVKLWRKARRKQQLPDPAELAAALKLVGYQSIKLDGRTSTVGLLKPGMQLDFGGIAKGYAAKEALAVLRKHGITRALVAGAGDIVAGDPPPGRDGWTIGIEALAKPNQDPTQFVLLKNEAISTSGDAYQAVVVNGKRYSHHVDPKTGMGLTRQSSVTIIAANGAAADGLAAAVCILGPERGMKLVESSPNVEALFVEMHDGKPRAFRSKGFAKFEVKPSVEK